MKLVDSMFYMKTMIEGTQLWTYNSGISGQLDFDKLVQDNAAGGSNKRKKSVQAAAFAGIKMIFCNFKEPQDALNVEIVDSSVMTHAMSLRANINLCYRLINLTMRNVIVQRTLSKVRACESRRSSHIAVS